MGLSNKYTWRLGSNFNPTASVRDDLLAQPSMFIASLENAINKGGVTIIDLGDAIASFCCYGLNFQVNVNGKEPDSDSLAEDIREAIFGSAFVGDLLNNAAARTVWGLEAVSRILQSDLLTICRFRVCVTTCKPRLSDVISDFLPDEFREKLLELKFVSTFKVIALEGSPFALTFLPVMLSRIGEHGKYRASITSVFQFHAATQMICVNPCWIPTSYLQ